MGFYLLRSLLCSLSFPSRRRSSTMDLREEVHELLGSIERYNPNNLDIFIEYAKATFDENEYDLDVYLTILKLFQFNAGRFDLNTTVAVLTKTLMGMPDNDFTLALALVAPEHHEKPEIKKVVYLAQLLETCRMAEFWTYLSDNRDVMSVKMLNHDEDDQEIYLDANLTGFENKMRQYVAHIIGVTYQEVVASVATEMLGGLSGAELKEYAAAHGWTMSDDGKTLKVGNKSETIKSKDIVETIEFGSLSSLMAATQGR